jgi:hypothetical protein
VRLIVGSANVSIFCSELVKPRKEGGEGELIDRGKGGEGGEAGHLTQLLICFRP